MPNTRSGVKTSEFWLSLVPPVVTIVGAVAAAEGYPINVPKAIAFVGGLAATALASHGYSGSRAVVKKELLTSQSYLEQNLLYTTPPPTPPVSPPTSTNLAIAEAQIADVA